MPPVLLNHVVCPHCFKTFVSQQGHTTHIHTVHCNQPKQDLDDVESSPDLLEQHYEPAASAGHDQSPQPPDICGQGLARDTSTHKQFHPHLTGMSVVMLLRYR